MWANYPQYSKAGYKKIKRASQQWTAVWSGYDPFQRFQVSGPAPMRAVDIGKQVCTCRFWQITGMPCVHAACAALAFINKNPADYCHKWLIMESYKATYMHSTNPIPGQELWDTSQYNRPTAPKIKRKPGPLKTKRRKDADMRFVQ